jgi:PAS domain S-box-containing protein
MLTLPLILLFSIVPGLITLISFHYGQQSSREGNLECGATIAGSYLLGIGVVWSITLILAIALGVVISNWITRQIQRLSQVVIAIADGKLDYPVPHSLWIPELEQMAQALNRIVQQMQKSHQTTCYHQTHNTEKALREAEVRLNNNIDSARHKRAEELREMRENRLQLQHFAMMELSKSQIFHSGQVEEALQKITQIAAHILDVERVSIWFYDPTRTKICCVDLYELTHNCHSCSLKLVGLDYPNYLHGLESDRMITVDNAHTDPRTQDFSASYLKPLGITSMLAVPLRSEGKTVGVLCLEHVGSPRQWLLEEQNFATHLAYLVALAVETRDRKIAEAVVRKRERYLEALVEVQHRLLIATNEADIFNSVLEPLVITSGASRGYIFTNSWDAAGCLLMSQRTGWCSTGIASEIDNPKLQNLPYDDWFPRWATVLAKGEPITGIVSTFPPSERAILEPQAILALAVFPLQVNSRFFGFIGFDNCVEAREWDALEINLLGVAAAVISLALEYKQAELALRQSEKSFRRSEATRQAMIAAIPDLLIRIDRQGTYLEVIEKPAIQLLNPRQTRPGANIYDITPPKHARERMAYVHQALETGEPQVYEYQFTLEGQVHYEEARIVAIHPDEALVIVRDITDRKVAEKTLQGQAEREHTLNQVVQAIRNSLHLNMIFATATREIAHLLHVDNVIIAQYLPNRGIWLHVAGYQQNSKVQLVGMEIPDADNPFAEQIKRLQIIRIDDTTAMTNAADQAIANAFSGAWLQLPLATNEGLWGSLCLSTLNKGFVWRDEDVDLVWAVADQLAIAIQQADLFHRLQLELQERQRAKATLQQLNRNLEERVQERTAQLKLALSAAKMGAWEWDIANDIQYWSPETYEMMGFQTDDQGRVLDQNGNEISPFPNNELFLNLIHPDDLASVLQVEQEALEQRLPFESECRIFRQNGSVYWCYTRGAYIYNSAGEAVKLVGISMDITERKQAEMRLWTSLREKEVLLREIHHRVKNNLQVISAMLNLQAAAIDDPTTLAVLQDSENRLRAMVLIHETLYQSKDLGKLNFSDYIQRLGDSILTLNQIQGTYIHLNYELEPASLNLETAIPCGLLLNELVTNAIKHAFPNRRTGEIRITLRQLPTLVKPDTIKSEYSLLNLPVHYVLEIADNGVGIPVDLDLNTLSSIGLKITYDLATQLRGTLELDCSKGTRFQLTFSELQYRRRF